MNVGKKPTNTSGYLGVTWWPRDQKWLAQITHQYKRRFIGYYDTKEEAARAFNEKARELRGPYARLNDL